MLEVVDDTPTVAAYDSRIERCLSVRELGPKRKVRPGDRSVRHSQPRLRALPMARTEFVDLPRDVDLVLDDEVTPL